MGERRASGVNTNTPALPRTQAKAGISTIVSWCRSDSLHEIKKHSCDFHDSESRSTQPIISLRTVTRYKSGLRGLPARRSNSTRRSFFQVHGSVHSNMRFNIRAGTWGVKPELPLKRTTP